MRPAEADYPFAPLASRRAPRLFRANGKPALTPAQRSLLRRCDREERVLAEAHRELAQALKNDDADLCVAACRRLLAIGERFGEFARDRSFA